MIRIFNVYYPVRTILLLLGEALVVTACFLLALLLTNGSDAYIVWTYEFGWLKIFSLTVVSIVLSYYFDLYEPQIVSERNDISFRLFMVLGSDCFLLSAVLVFFPAVGIANGTYAVGFLLLTPGLFLWRRLHRRLINLTLFRERIYVLGSGAQAQFIVDTIDQRKDTGMEVVGWDRRDLDKETRKQFWIAEVARLAELSPPVHRIIVAIENQRNELPVQELLALRFRGMEVQLATGLNERLSGRLQLDGLRPSDFLFSEGFRIKPSQQIGRQMLSTLVSLIGLLGVLPWFPIIALLVRLSSKGPIFFRQTRVGIGGKPFQVLKFRTMFTDAEAGGARWATKSDPRVTKIGMFMRKTRIDELPQLINVIRGDMALVGPRPERPEFTTWLGEELPFFYLRTLVRPGLTGWAQIRYGYGATLAETKIKLEYDLYYIKHMSASLDLLIMFETIKTILRRRGAQ